MADPIGEFITKLMGRDSPVADGLPYITRNFPTDDESLFAYEPGNMPNLDAYINTINSAQGYPSFRGAVNPTGFESFLALAPESTNIEDRRGDSIDDFIKRSIEAHAR